MRFVYEGLETEILFFYENLNRAISKRYLPMCEDIFLKHDLEIQIVDSVYTDGASAMLGNFFCFVKSG